MVAGPRFTVPVSVILARHTVGRDGWSVPSWRVVGVVAGEHLPAGEARGVRLTTGSEEQFLWGGLRLELYRDATESYWSNLMGQTPSLFVLCTQREDGLLEPIAVTADMHEACSGVEGDHNVFAAPVPPEVYQQIERFVVEHHRPQQRRKRKRIDWTGSAES
jgi:hypothetical protein